ncbi:MAG: hypothetical protein JWN83_400 [Chitinophagaceae bacterium]|nr:hypothetical protein [Chitinophagaceae bacterium]
MLLIYLPAITSRTEYVFDLIFRNELGIEYITTTDIKIFETYQQEKINYSSTCMGEEIFIKASSLLFEQSIKKINITVEKRQEIPVLFPNADSRDIGFDIFGAVFYMVSRYEEYLPFNPDKHGRFKAADSVAYQNNFLQYPVVNTWINFLKNILAKKFPSLQFYTSSFKAIVTYDIDIAYAFSGRGLLRLSGATAKDVVNFNFKNIINRLGSLFTKKDPWDVYDFLKDAIIKNKLTSIFFFLVGDYSRYDKNVSYEHPLMVRLIKKVSAFSEIGIHPSYKSSVIPGKILIEKNRLEKISDKPITKSRQHYLKFNLPDTYNQLLAAGITEDYSMGFADIPGFRAGICTPFYFYDLKNEKITSLKIFPMTCMEANFLYYSKLKPEESLEVILALINEVKKAGGIFISVWHNHTVSEDDLYKDWKWVHNEMIKRISDKN